MYQAVIFDLDGTLLDTLDDLADSMNAALEAMGLPTHPVDAYRYFVGDGAVMLATRALPEDRRDAETVQRAHDLMRAEYKNRWDAKTRPYDGVLELLDALHERGLKLAVLTNKPHDFAELCVQRLLPRERFDAVVGVTPDVPPKPDPTGVRRLTDAWGIPAERIVYLGDTNTDMQTARSAGFHAVGVTWGFRPADELTAAGAQTLIDNPRAVLGLL
jgi:phosphoglycolate phosphatase